MSIDWDKYVLSPCETIFGESETYMPAAGGVFEIVGIFDQAYKEVALIDPDIGANSLMPVLGVRATQFPSPPLQNDQVYVPSVKVLYYVRDVRQDGHGSIKLLLADAGQT